MYILFGADWTHSAGDMAENILFNTIWRPISMSKNRENLISFGFKGYIPKQKQSF